MLISERDRFKVLYEEEKEKRRTREIEKKEALKEIKAFHKETEKLKLEAKKQQKEK